MKKILLLIACGLLTTFTAGSAMAMSLDLLSGPSLSDPSISGTTIELSGSQYRVQRSNYRAVKHLIFI